jgi:MFS family permease
MLLLGRLSDAYGRVWFFRAGFVIFTAFGALATLSWNIYSLIAFSIAMGFGSAILSPLSTAIVSQVFPAGERGSALGINAMAVYLGLTSAPFLGGIIVGLAGWRAVFLVTAAAAAAGLAISFISMKGLRHIGAPLGIGVAGPLLYLAGLTALSIYLTTYLIAPPPIAYSLLAIAAASLAGFIAHEASSKSPMLPPSLFKNKSFIGGNVTALLNYISTFSIIFVFSVYLQAVLGVSPVVAGLVLASEPIFMAALSPFSGRLSDRYEPRVLAAAGMGIIGAAFLFLYFADLRSLAEIAAGLALIGIGFGLFSAPNTNSVMGSAPPDKYGVASGTLGTMRFTGQLLSVALASALLANSLPKEELLGIFTGVLSTASSVYYADFLRGLRLILAVSAALSLLGVYTSLIREKGPNKRP